MLSVHRDDKASLCSFEHETRGSCAVLTAESQLQSGRLIQADPASIVLLDKERDMRKAPFLRQPWDEAIQETFIEPIG